MGLVRIWLRITQPRGRGLVTRHSSGASRWPHISAVFVTQWSSPGHKRIKGKGGLRSQFTHCTDIAPTILEAAGLPEPKEVNGVAQMPMQGVSFSPRSMMPMRPRDTRNSISRFWETGAMYKDGWLACWRLDRIPWKIDPETLARFAPGKWDPNQRQV